MSDRYLRQSFLGSHSEGIFKDLVVGIVGIGGGGSHIVQQLAHVGLHNFIIVDPDIVELKNLNRLVGATEKDIELKTPKVVVGDRLIRGLCEEAQILSLQSRWQLAHTHLRQCDVIFGCVDSARERKELESFSRRFDIPYIDIGMDVFEDAKNYFICGQVVRSLPGEPCLECLGVITPELIAEEARKYGAVGGRPQVVWPNGILASTAIGLFVEIFAPWHRPVRPVACIEYDGNKHSLEASNRLQYVVDGQCPHYKTDEVGDPFFK